ncbi:DUF2752 domain-containing protein [Gordonia shandongensis]|uniref:DUF2752 domain-containing protein n=1 Tax=Gordonia shandongensis TaxID=376351 RepID=UPI00316AEBB6
MLVGTAVVGGIIWFADPTTPGGVLPTCPTKSLLHIDCPGCGSLRMMYSLMHGDFGSAVHFNAVGVVAMFFVAAAFVTYTVGLWTGRRIRNWQHWRYAPMVLLAITLAWFVVRNIPIEPFSNLKV